MEYQAQVFTETLRNHRLFEAYLQSTRSSDVILVFGKQPTKQGNVFPLKQQKGPPIAA